MKKALVFVIVLVVTMIAVAGATNVWRLLAANDWIDRCSDETSGVYIADDKAREDYCSRTVDGISQDL
jgi:hypothetical protein